MTSKQPDRGGSNLDPQLSSLFASSLGPVEPIKRLTSQIFPRSQATSLNYEALHLQEVASHPDESRSDPIKFHSSFEPSKSEPSQSIVNSKRHTTRKRKLILEADDLEEKYFHKLSTEKESAERSRISVQDVSISVDKMEDGRTTKAPDDSSQSNVSSTVRLHSDEQPPVHETQTKAEKELDLEKSKRTVFLSNVSTAAIKSRGARKVLLNHVTSCAPTGQEKAVIPLIESIRFRSTAFARNGLPRKAAYVTRDLMDTTTKATNAYVVFSSQNMAREACRRLNGTVVLDRHIRVDSVAHPAIQDHKKCVFVGNLGFVDDDISTKGESDKNKKPTSRGKQMPADVEEGLWREFGKLGKVDNVRVIRDKSTRVGKGIAYVQFEDEKTVEKALRLNDKKFPPMLPRPIRVSRARRVKRGVSERQGEFRVRASSQSIKRSRENVPGRDGGAGGARARKLLGRAGATRLKRGDEGRAKGKKGSKSSAKRAAQFKAGGFSQGKV